MREAAQLPELLEAARRQLGLPVREGGVGFGTLGSRHQAAYLGSWALCLQQVLDRLPHEDAEALTGALTNGDHAHPVAAKLLDANSALQALGVADTKLPDLRSCAARAQRRAQARLSRAVGTVTRNSLLADHPHSRIRLRSCGGPGAGAFLLGAASETSGTELLDGTLRHGLSWRLGLPTTSPGLTCSIGCIRRCGAPLDPLGEHPAVCKYGGFKTTRHSLLVQQLRSILRESFAIVSPREVEVPAWRRADGLTARIDVAFLADGTRTFVDVTIRHPGVAKYRAQAARLDGHAAAVAERAKRLWYPALAAAGLPEVVPFAVETYGRLGPSARRLLAQARHRLAEADERFRGWAGTALLQRWQALLSCALQRSLYEAAQAAWGRPPLSGDELLAACLPS